MIASSSKTGIPIFSQRYPRYICFVATCLATFVVVLAGVAASAQVSTIPIDYAAHEAMKADLSASVVVLDITPRPGAFEDPAMVPHRFGQGVVTMVDGRPLIVTSLYLVTEASAITAMTPDGENRVQVQVVTEDQAAGLTRLSLPESLAGTLKHPPFQPGSITGPDLERNLFSVTPVTPGMTVLTETVVTDRAPFPMDSFFMVPGTLPAGTVLFDRQGIPCGIALRESYSGNRFTFVASLTPPPAITPPDPATETVDAPSF